MGMMKKYFFIVILFAHLKRLPPLSNKKSCARLAFSGFACFGQSAKRPKT
ncbi:hypothetical protein NBRC111894_1712 [Sporolactobacillus inulinus]|uniref:Uncharacterized protein n=1 Tax=Sporolactobacillus inulinus TaxID=2078 RepID=A0A4Y1ZBV9_9BACL|nr:hypothetical protein NBRC111894_1712 [Sporolactobacillus inulinus]